MLVLLRLLDPLPSGSEQVYIDDLPLHQFDRVSLRRRIISIPQDAVFLPDGCTVKENLDPFEEASDEESLDVLERVQLGSFVREHGLAKGMSADTLSAGQKQLFSLGRAILRRRLRDKVSQLDTPGGVLLLDEVSSNVDKNTDQIMQEILKDEFRHYTIIMVSHRLEMVVDFFTTVVVLDKGRVVETGRPQHLIEAEGSRFRELWKMGNHGNTSRTGSQES
jgi:ABC-type multidrug transport system fused ATPase/permease subunit